MGKAKGPHVEKRLTLAFVKKAPPGRHTDGGGLYLVVSPSGSRRWVARLTLNGERRDFGLGPINKVGLAEARERAAEFRRAAYLGLDPRLERERQGGSISFREGAYRAHEMVLEQNRNEKANKQWITTLETYVFPEIGNRDVADIRSGDIVRVLRPIWAEKHETARKIKQRIGAVMDWAIANNFRQSDNPISSVSKGLQRINKEPSHFAAVRHEHAHEVWDSIRSKASGAKRKDLVGITALQFAILTVSRSGPVRFAKWSQLDACQEGMASQFPHWFIPPEGMKAGKGFTIPLSKAALRLLEGWREVAPKTEYIFASPYKPHQPISDATMRKALQEHAPGMTVHGWRSTFADWVADKTDVGPEVSSAALAHGRDKTDAAYRRTQYIEKRYPVMEAWARYLEHNHDYYYTLEVLRDEERDRMEGVAQTLLERHESGDFDKDY